MLPVPLAAAAGRGGLLASRGAEIWGWGGWLVGGGGWLGGLEFGGWGVWVAWPGPSPVPGGPRGVGAASLLPPGLRGGGLSLHPPGLLGVAFRGLLWRGSVSPSVTPLCLGQGSGLFWELHVHDYNITAANWSDSLCSVVSTRTRWLFPRTSHTLVSVLYHLDLQLYPLSLVVTPPFLTPTRCHTALLDRLKVHTQHSVDLCL